MNALQPSEPRLQPVAPPKPRQRRRRHSQPNTLMAFEATAKLSINVVISVAAVYALTQLVPYGFAQQKKLQEIRAEDERVEGRVSSLQTDFSRYFDPHQAKTVMQEQSKLIAPGQRPVVLLEPKATGVEARATLSK